MLLENNYATVEPLRVTELQHNMSLFIFTEGFFRGGGFQVVNHSPIFATKPLTLCMALDLYCSHG